MHLFHLYISVAAGSAGPAEISGNAAGCTVTPTATDWANRAPQITWGDYNSEKSFPKQMFETIENVSAMNNGILFNIKSTFKHLVTTQEGGWSLFKCK